MIVPRLAHEPLEPRTLLANPIGFGSSLFDTAYEVAAYPGGGVVVAGLFKGTADFDPTSGTSTRTSLNQDTDFYVARYNAQNRLVWAIRIGGIEGELDDGSKIDTPIDPGRAASFDLGVGLQPRDLGEYVTGLAVDAAGDILVTGAFRGVVDFDSGAGTAVLASNDGEEFLDAFLLKLAGDGSFRFVRQIGGRFTDVPESITLDSAQNVYLTGYYTRSADFDPGRERTILTTEDEGRQAIFVAKYNTAGDLIWARDFKNNEVRRVRRAAGNSVAVDGSGNVFVTGSFSGETDFDPSLLGRVLIERVGETDAFVAKLDSAGRLSWVKTFTGEEHEGGLAIALSADGASVYAGMYFEEAIDADPGSRVLPVLATPEERGDDPDRGDLLFVKLTASSGALNWARPIGNAGWETLGGIAVDASGAMYATGGFYGAIDLNPGANRVIHASVPGAEDFEDANDDDRDFSYDVFTLKLDSNGRYLASDSFGSVSDDYGIGLALDASGRPVVCGQFRGTQQRPGGSKLRASGNEDSFVLLYDENLAVLPV
jgi:hypothetical protein